jgi:hypothetical protein
LGTFSDSVNPGSFKILNQPDYIFLCGGRLDDFDQSIRAHFYRDKVEKNPDLIRRVQLAEEADKWYQSRKVFSDLLELEEHLAGLSACVLLFVESPGAIAEFGAFSQMELLQQKLIVVIEDSHFGRPSFIHNGLVEHLNRIRPGSVFSYLWFFPPGHARSGEIDLVGVADTCSEVEEEVQKRLRLKPRTTGFRADDLGHLMLLIADLVALNVVAIQKDLQEILSSLSLSIEVAELRKCLFLLGQLGLISTFHYGNVDYHINLSGKPEYVDYAPRKPADRSRLRILLREDFPLTPEKNKARAAYERKVLGGRP